MPQLPRTAKAEVALDLYGSSTGGIKAEQVTFPVVNGLLDASDPTVLSCVEHYFPARSASAVDWAFASALDEMLSVHYISPVDADESLAEGSRIEAHSALGAGMEVERVRGVQYGDTLLTGELAAQAIEMSLKDPGDLSGATHEFDYLVRSINDRYNLGYSAYVPFYEAASGQDKSPTILEPGRSRTAHPGTSTPSTIWWLAATVRRIALPRRRKSPL